MNRYCILLALGGATLYLFLHATAHAQNLDCNSNGIVDELELDNSMAEDCNQNGVPDDCDISPQGLSFTEISSFQPESSPLQFFDIDGDGDKDMLLNTDAGLSIRRNDGAAVFAEAEAIALQLSPFPQIKDTIVGDFIENGEDKLDVLLWSESFFFPGPRFGSTSLKIIHENAQGDFVATDVTFSESGISGQRFFSLAASDLDQDGLLDIAFSGTLSESSSGTGVAFNLSGNGEFLPTVLSSRVLTLVSSFYSNPFIPYLFGYRAGERSGLVVASQNRSRSMNTLEVSTIGELEGAKPGIGNRQTNSPHVLFTSLTTRSGRALAINRFRNFTLSIFAGPTTPIDESFSVGNIDGGEAQEVVTSSGALTTFDVEGGYTPRGRVFDIPAGFRVTDVVELTGDESAEILLRGSSEEWKLYRNNSSLPLAAATSTDRDANLIPDECQRAVPLDYTGDGFSDLVVARPLLGGWYWYIRGANEELVQFGLSNPQFRDSLFAGDYDGNGTIDPGVLRDMNGFLFWYARNQDKSATVTQWGLRGDTALTGYFDTDTSVDLAVVRDLLGGKYWFIKRSATEEVQASLWGLAGDTPFRGDRNGDGIDELIVARKTNGFLVWYAREVDGEALSPRLFGLSSDEILPPFDFDADGIDDFAVVRKQNGELYTYIDRSSLPSSPLVIVYGLEGDTIIQSVSTISGRPDITAFRDSDPSGLAEFFRNSPLDGDRHGARFQYGLRNDWVLNSHGTAKQAPS